MAASVNDKFSKVSTGARPTTTTVASIRSVAGTSLICDDLTGWDTDAAVHFSTYQLDGQGDVVAGTQTDMKGTVSGNTISNIVITGGTDTGNAVGDIVQQLPTARYAKDLADGLLVSLDQDGTLKAGAVDNAAAIADGVVSTAKIADAAVTPEKRSGGFAQAVVSVTSTGAGSVTGLTFQPKFAIFFSTLTSSNVTASSSMHSWDGSNVYNVSSSTRPASSSGAGSRASTGSAVNIFSINSGGSIVAECVFTPTAFTSDGFTYTVGTSSANVSVFAILFG